MRVPRGENRDEGDEWASERKREIARETFRAGQRERERDVGREERCGRSGGTREGSQEGMDGREGERCRRGERARETDCHYVLSNHTVEKGRLLVSIFSSLISIFLPLSLVSLYLGVSPSPSCSRHISSRLGHPRETVARGRPTRDDAVRTADPGFPFM